MEPFDALIDPGSLAVARLFPTPLASVTLTGAAALNEALAATILAREAAEPGIEVSNRGGWHSAEFRSWCGPAGLRVLDAARRLVERLTVAIGPAGPQPARVSWRLAAWANVSRAGDANRPHGHPGAFWSGIYWVDDGGAAEDPALGGLLELADPRGLLPAMHAPDLRPAIEECLGDGQGQVVTPRAGTMVLFPSWLVHAVTPYRGTRPRISVAFNASLGNPGEMPLP